MRRTALTPPLIPDDLIPPESPSRSELGTRSISRRYAAKTYNGFCLLFRDREMLENRVHQ